MAEQQNSTASTTLSSLSNDILEHGVVPFLEPSDLFELMQCNGFYWKFIHNLKDAEERFIENVGPHFSSAIAQMSSNSVCDSFLMNGDGSFHPSCFWTKLYRAFNRMTVNIRDGKKSTFQFQLAGNAAAHVKIDEVVISNDGRVIVLCVESSLEVHAIPRQVVPFVSSTTMTRSSSRRTRRTDTTTTLLWGKKFNAKLCDLSGTNQNVGLPDFNILENHAVEISRRRHRNIPMEVQLLQSSLVVLSSYHGLQVFDLMSGKLKKCLIGEARWKSGITGSLASALTGSTLQCGGGDYIVLNVFNSLYVWHCQTLQFFCKILAKDLSIVGLDVDADLKMLDWKDLQVVGWKEGVATFRSTGGETTKVIQYDFHGKMHRVNLCQPVNLPALAQHRNDDGFPVRVVKPDDPRWWVTGVHWCGVTNCDESVVSQTETTPEFKYAHSLTHQNSSPCQTHFAHAVLQLLEGIIIVDTMTGESICELVHLDGMVMDVSTAPVKYQPQQYLVASLTFCGEVAIWSSQHDFQCISTFKTDAECLGGALDLRWPYLSVYYKELSNASAIVIYRFEEETSMLEGLCPNLVVASTTEVEAGARLSQVLARLLPNGIVLLPNNIVCTYSSYRSVPNSIIACPDSLSHPSSSTLPFSKPCCTMPGPPCADHFFEIQPRESQPMTSRSLPSTNAKPLELSLLRGHSSNGGLPGLSCTVCGIHRTVTIESYWVLNKERDAKRKRSTSVQPPKKRRKL